MSTCVYANASSVLRITASVKESTSFISLQQPNYELLEKEVEKRKVALQEAKLKAKGLNPDGTPALSTLGGFSPASKPCKAHSELRQLGP